MALVLRKAVMPKNVSLFKCIKGRNLATTSNRKTSVVVSTAAPRRRWREEHRRAPLGGQWIEKSKRLLSTKPEMGTTVKKSPPPVRCCVSCPDMEGRARAIKANRARHNTPSPPRTKPVSHEVNTIHMVPPCPYLAATACCFNKPPPACAASGKATSPCRPPAPSDNTSKRDFSAKCPPPCGPCGPCGSCCGCPPCGCGPCCCGNCLPPPCNQPPKCLQYMTGYYYYPYGFWFCGPYHVSGVCCPVSCPCPPKCPPCPCPCPSPCCICPSAAAALGATVAAPAAAPARKATSNPGSGSSPSPPGSSEWQKNWKDTFPNKIPNTCCSTPQPSPQQIAKDPSAKTSKSGISKFVPSGNNAATNPKARAATDIRTPPARSYSTNSTACYYQYPQNYQDVTQHCQEYPNGYISRTLPRSETLLSLEAPRTLPSREERDRPNIKPGTFDYTAIPSYRYPYPPPPLSAVQLRAYDM